MTDREERQHVIKVLKNMLDWMEAANLISSKPERIEAVKYAIASIETDLKYDLLYEETSEQADKPITKNCESCRYYGSHHKVCNYCYKCSLWTEQESTNKNDLGVDCIDRKKLIDWINIWDITPIIKNPLIRHIQGMSSATPQEPKIGHCKDCKYFEYDSVAKIDGVPLIVAHEICSKWGRGCKTNENGYCFLFESKSEVEE